MICRCEPGRADLTRGGGGGGGESIALSMVTGLQRLGEGNCKD